MGRCSCRLWGHIVDVEQRASFWLTFCIAVFVGVPWPISFIVPLIVYFALMRFYRLSVSWLRRGVVTGPTWALLLATILSTGVSLVAWVALAQPRLDDIIGGIPHVHPGLFWVGALTFSLVNALWEEFIFKGVMWESLEALSLSSWQINLMQTLLFGVIHYKGFPRGLLGVFMAAVFGFVMGLLRQWSRGMLAPILAHFFADLAICGVCYWMVTYGVGMGRDYDEAHVVFRETLEEACDVLGERLDTLMFEGPAAKLDLTPHAQPAIVATSVGIWRVLRQRVRHAPSAFIGHSLEEYSACVAAGVLTLAEGLRLVRHRAALMQAAMESERSAMAAILGLPVPVPAIKQICERASRSSAFVDVAGDNAPGQTIVSGHRDAVRRAMAIALALGAEHAKLLKIRTAGHCRGMAPAQAGLRTYFDGLSLRAPLAPLVTNAGASFTQASDDIREALITQMTHRVRFAESVKAAAALNPAWIEIGPGKVLGGLVSRCLSGDVRIDYSATLSELHAAYVALRACDEEEA